MNELEQIVGRLDTPKQGPRRRPSRLQQLMHELDDRDQQGDPDLGAMRGRYARLPGAITFLDRLAVLTTVNIWLTFAAACVLVVSGELELWVATAVAAGCFVVWGFQRAAVVMMSDGALLAVDCERSLRVQREATLHILQLVEDHLAAQPQRD